MSRQRRTEPTWDEFGREIGLRLQKARERRGLSQERTAHLAGIASYTYQKFEKGESRPGSPLNPRLSTLLALCRVLELRLEDLLPDPPPSAPLEHRAGPAQASPDDLDPRARRERAALAPGSDGGKQRGVPPAAPDAH